MPGGRSDEGKNKGKARCPVFSIKGSKVWDLGSDQGGEGGMGGKDGALERLERLSTNRGCERGARQKRRVVNRKASRS